MICKSSLVIVAVLIAVVAGVAIPLPGSTPAVILEGPECYCQLTQQTITWSPTPDCYDSTVFTVQNMVSGICADPQSLCPPARDCSYSISITVLAKATMNCDFAIYKQTLPMPGSTSVVASCISCRQLNYSPATDPVFLKCDTASTYEERWGATACPANSPNPPCPTANLVAMKILFCNVCNLP